MQVCRQHLRGGQASLCVRNELRQHHCVQHLHMTKAMLTKCTKEVQNGKGKL